MVETLITVETFLLIVSVIWLIIWRKKYYEEVIKNKIDKKTNDCRLQDVNKRCNELYGAIYKLKEALRKYIEKYGKI